MIELLSEAEGEIHKADWLAVELEAIRVTHPPVFELDWDAMFVCVVLVDPEEPSGRDVAVLIDTQELFDDYSSVDDGRRQWLEVPRIALVTYLMALEGHTYDDLVATGIIHDGDPFTTEKGDDNE